MKKIISLLLALVMVFSITTVAYCEDGAAEDTTTTVAADEGTGEEEEGGQLDWLLDLPFWTVKPGLKIAKIALKLVKAFVKIGMALGFIDSDEIIDQIVDLIASSQQETETTEPATTVAPEETTAAA